MYSKSTKVIRKFLLFCTFLFVTGCRSNKPSYTLELGDGGLISHEPCGPPCFYGITPGISREEDVISLLNEMEVFNKCSFFDNTDESGHRGYSCQSMMSFNFDKNPEVVGVGFKPTIEISIEELIQTFGIPDGLLVTIRGTPELPTTLVMILFFDSIQANIILHEQVSEAYTISPANTIDKIVYSEINTYNSVSKYASSWNGYGSYNLTQP